MLNPFQVVVKVCENTENIRDSGEYKLWDHDVTVTRRALAEHDYNSLFWPTDMLAIEFSEHIASLWLHTAENGPMHVILL